MKEFGGKIFLKVTPLVGGKEAQAAFDTEIYLNGEVAAEIYRKFEVHLRVHIDGNEGWPASKGG